MALRVTALVTAVCFACNNSAPSPAPRADLRQKAGVIADASDAADPSPASSALDDSKLGGPGKIPFEFPAQRSGGRANDFVLAPAKSWIDEAIEHGPETQPFSYHAGRLLRAGQHESLVRRETGELSVIPNALIIRIEPGGRASPGDIVLTSWAAAAGLQRAIVVPGGEPRRPRVHYLDLGTEIPSNEAARRDTLGENQFKKLDRAGEVGTSAACDDAGRWHHYIVVARDGDRMLGLGFAGKLRSLLAARCQPLPLAPKLEPRQVVYVPAIGEFVSGEVTRVEPQIGRVWVRYRFGGEFKQHAFGYINVAVDPLLPAKP